MILTGHSPPQSYLHFHFHFHESHDTSRIAHQSSSSSLPFPLTALCLALNASANPPARLPPPRLFGVARPLFAPLPPPFAPVPRLIPESLAGLASGFLPVGRFAGGAGGVGFARVARPGAALPLSCTEGVGTARGGAAGGGGGGGARTVSWISST
jgi:hypothetical protein